MRIHRFLIAGGNPTALVSGCPKPDRPSLLTTLLEQAEQVGFIDHASPTPQLQMMGGEFCINATLAYAFLLGGSGTIATSGAKGPVAFRNDRAKALISLSMPRSVQENIVLLEGIGFILYEDDGGTRVTREGLAALCRRYGLPAFGAILYVKDAITPFVYVAGADSFVRETACGSGSVALYFYNGTSQVRQPTGQVINVTGDQRLQISAQVTVIET